VTEIRGKYYNSKKSSSDASPQTKAVRGACSKQQKAPEKQAVNRA
jgi:hypothetical protein